MVRYAFFLIVAVLALGAAEPSEAAKKKEGMGVGQCWIEGTVNPAGPGEAISSCCLDDGCWICNAGWDDCVWDPKVSRGTRAQKGVRPPLTSGETLDPGTSGSRQPLREVAPRPGKLAPAQ